MWDADLARAIETHVGQLTEALLGYAPSRRRLRGSMTIAQSRNVP
jgi:hypothetical protein